MGWAVRYYFTLSWFGRPVLQLPEDLIRLQEVVNTLQPDVIIESGIYSSGSFYSMRRSAKRQVRAASHRGRQAYCHGHTRSHRATSAFAPH